MNIKLLLGIVILLLVNMAANGQTCPNGSFESWTSHAYQEPDSGWYTSDIGTIATDDSMTAWPVTGISGKAIHLQTAIIGKDTLQAYVVNTSGDPAKGQGGVPYTQQPTHITGYYRYNLPGNDSAIIWVQFKKSGSVVSNDIIKFRGTGAVSSFTAFSFPLSLSVVPDSVIIAASSSNYFGPGLQPGSWLELDQLAFTGPGVTQNIPGGSFNTWTPLSFDKATGWNEQQNGNHVSGASKSANHNCGNYSIALTTLGNQPTQISTGLNGNNGPYGGLPYSQVKDTLLGYYEYIPAGTDTAGINITLYHAGTIVGGNFQNLFSASSWTYFEIPISASATPDTMRIDIQSSSWNRPENGSVLYLDCLQLKSQPADVPAVKQPLDNTVVYPIPALNILNIKLDDHVQGIVYIKLYDVTGRTIEMQSTNVPGIISIPVGNLVQGIYFYELRNSNIIRQGTFVKE